MTMSGTALRWVDLGGAPRSPGGPRPLDRPQEPRSAAPAAADLALWTKAGWDAEDALLWWAHGAFEPGEALLWRNAGFNPVQAQFVDVLVGYQRLQTPSAMPSKAWRESELPPHFVCLCVAAGITDIDAARRRHVTGPEAAGPYRALTEHALAHGLDPWRMSMRISMPTIPSLVRLAAARLCWRALQVIR